MKYLFFILLCLSVVACEPKAETAADKGLVAPSFPADSNGAGQQVLSHLLSGYLEMKEHFPALRDTQQLHVLAAQMIEWSDSLTRLSVALPDPTGDSVGMMAQGIADELKGLLAESEMRGISLSFQLTGLQLYELLRIMPFRAQRVYRFQTREGEEANWLDIRSVSGSPFLENNSVQVKAVDSLLLQ